MAANGGVLALNGGTDLSAAPAADPQGAPKPKGPRRDDYQPTLAGTNKEKHTMRIARKLFLMSAMALVAMAFAATGASATTITDEPGGVNCGTATSTSGGCALHATGEVQLLGHVFGIEDVASDCNIEFTGRVGGDGLGYVDGATFSNHAGLTDCTRTPCDLPWKVTVEHVVSGGSETRHLTARFCVLKPDNTKQYCTVTLPITESPDHDYESVFHVRASESVNAPGCEVEGQLHLEGTGIEINA